MLPPGAGPATVNGRHARLPRWRAIARICIFTDSLPDHERIPNSFVLPPRCHEHLGDAGRLPQMDLLESFHMHCHIYPVR